MLAVPVIARPARAAVLAAAELLLDQYHCYRAQRSTISTQSSCGISIGFSNIQNIQAPLDLAAGSRRPVPSVDLYKNRHGLYKNQGGARPPGGRVVIFIKLHLSLIKIKN